MAARTIIALLLLPYLSLAQIVSPFEFFDHKERSTTVTAVTNYNEGILYAYNSGSGIDGYNSLIHLRGNGDLDTLYLSSQENEKVEFIHGENSNLYTVFYGSFGCDYGRSGLIYNVDEKRNIPPGSSGEPFNDVCFNDASITFINGNPQFHLLISEDCNTSANKIRTLEQILLDSTYFTRIKDEHDITQGAYKLLEIDNQLFYIDNNHKLFNQKTKDTVLQLPSKCIKVEEHNEHIVFFSSQIDWVNKSDLKVDSTWLIDLSQYLDVTKTHIERQFAIHNDGVIFFDIGIDESSIFYIDKELNIKTKYIESIPKLVPRLIHKSNDQFISVYNIFGSTLIRQTTDILPYEYERVDFELVDPSFHSYRIDTFRVRSDGDTFFYEQRYMQSSVEINNLKIDTINTFTLNSHRRRKQGGDCGFDMITIDIDTTLLPEASITFTGLFGYNIEDLEEPYFFAYGADYKLDEDLSNNFVSGPLTSDLVEERKLTDIAVAPNPFNNRIVMKIQEGEKVSVEIFDLKGIMLYSKEHIGKDEELNLNQLGSGIYILKASTRTDSRLLKILKI